MPSNPAVALIFFGSLFILIGIVEGPLKLITTEVVPPSAWWKSAISFFLGTAILATGIAITTGWLPRHIEASSSGTRELNPTVSTPAPQASSMSANQSSRPAPEQEQASLSGIWESQSTTTSTIASDGLQVPGEEQNTIVIKLVENGDKLSGEYLRMTNTLCPKATVKGERQGDTISLTSYFFPSPRSSCCAGSVVQLKGKLISTSQISGAFEPKSKIKQGCPGAVGTSVWTKVE